MFAYIIQTMAAVSLACAIAAGATSPRSAARIEEYKSFGVPQEQPTQVSLIAEAERQGYEVRRTEFLGNARTADIVLRRRLLFTEGDVFTSGKLEQSLRNLSKLKMIEAVRLEDVEVNLDRQYKVIDLAFRVREKRKAR